MKHPFNCSKRKVGSVRLIPSLSTVFYLNLKGSERMGDITMISIKNWIIDILSECKDDNHNHNACHGKWLGFWFQLVHTLPRKEITAVVLNLAMEKYSKSHLGIDFTDLEQFGSRKGMRKVS